MAEMHRPQTPQESWDAMKAGNDRFHHGDPAHPRQDVDRREIIAEGQTPYAALFGCADSRLSAEIIFDAGLGDLFVVRNAGQVIGDTVLGSLEYAVEVLNVPLILVLGHDNCGAIRATIDVSEGKVPATGHYIHEIAKRIMSTVELANSQGKTDIDTITQMHIKDTVDDMLRDSKVVREAVAAGKLGVVGANYSLRDGQVHPLFLIGDLK